MLDHILGDEVEVDEEEFVFLMAEANMVVAEQHSTMLQGQGGFLRSRGTQRQPPFQAPSPGPSRLGGMDELMAAAAEVALLDPAPAGKASVANLHGERTESGGPAEQRRGGGRQHHWMALVNTLSALRLQLEEAEGEEELGRLRNTVDTIKAYLGVPSAPPGWGREGAPMDGLEGEIEELMLHIAS
eukprot:CAMPEP_0182882498 /NCGR_PEP_ID=MMETSP0034_2-20130328/17825_1 /TAXON_ID=156128 /ORGANISM="Nephroselmis pyriformis, Strain CCMP717" /LENGTH=185 /DNA_ID=CAMNT_0025015599 /DNA_START=203 /DNA_END=757 /DNA_ORIENTATION=-